MMTKKDFIKIAGCIKFSKRDFNELVNNLVEIFKIDNPKFDEMIFRKACLIKEKMYEADEDFIDESIESEQSKFERGKEDFKEIKLKCNDCEKEFFALGKNYSSVCSNCNGELEEVKQ